ncbi:RNA methyltransferase [Pelotalea chapellei]|uniref:RNA methyltransferase n=1 Tax=Pelotalea chapellei TaxID=44671 RepID=A0ABS5UBJ2_9BACT|nr:RNA methyltransferase [Pelotalea chapellei]MBT1073062.1 RNA methyltransferase [Pelotalea chapellei]
MSQFPCNLSIALLHYPVYNKHREVVTTALTNLDLHDIARASRTFGLDRFYIVTPSVDQRILAEKIAGHWQDGWGATYNTDRKEALSIIKVCDTLKTAKAEFQSFFSKEVKTVITGAAKHPGSIGFNELRHSLTDPEQPFMLLLGTGWGLTGECFTAAGHILEPIQGTGSYNHLSVRSAAAIMLDRLKGTR